MSRLLLFFSFAILMVAADTPKEDLVKEEIRNLEGRAYASPFL